MSRKDQVNIKKDNKDVQLLKEELWTRRTTVEVTILKRTMTADKSEILEEIKKNNTREQKVVQALEKNDGLSWKENRIVYLKGRIYISNNKKIKEKILWENHDLVDMRHPEQQRMLELLK